MMVPEHPAKSDFEQVRPETALMLLLWQNGVHVDDASFAGCGRGYAGCGLTSAWFRSGWGRFDGRRGGGAHQGLGGIPWMTETVDRIVAGSPEVRRDYPGFR